MTSDGGVVIYAGKIVLGKTLRQRELLRDPHPMAIQGGREAILEFHVRVTECASQWRGVC